MDRGFIAQARDRRPAPSEPWERKPGDDEGGPKRPKVDRPDTNDLLRRMRRVDPNQSRRYRQRTGE
ncbi:ubiquitin-like protein UBact [bacterium]|nr:ubiquitin-like protein UBact [bacterium]